MPLTKTPVSMMEADMQAGLRNVLINGGFDVWQRGTANASADAQGFLADRWKTTNIGTTISQSQGLFGPGGIEGDPPFAWQGIVTAVTANGNYAALSQAIESVRTLSGRSAVLTFWARADANRNMSVEFTQSFGSGGSPSAAVLGIGVTKVALTTTWTKFTIPVTIPSISAATIGTNADDSLRVLFWFSAGSDFDIRTATLGHQSGTFLITRAQLEPGTAATPFEQRPLALERSLCSHYAQILGGAVCTFGSGMYTTTTNFRAVVPLARPLRASGTPTLTVRGPVGNFGTTSLVASAVAFGNLSPGTAVCAIDMTVSGAAAGNAGMAACSNAASSLLLSNELP